MDEMILSRRQTPIEIALDIDSTGHTTARKLYKWLELRPGDYSRWVKQNITENPYAEEGKEYSALVRKTSEQGGRPSADYLLSASFAKKLAMMSRSEKGEQAREYFVRVEDALAKAVLTPAEMLLRNAQILVEQERKMRELEKRQQEQEEELKEIAAKVETHPTGWYTVAGYASKIGMNLDLQSAGELGRKATRLSKQWGKKIQTTPDPRFGKVNVYCPEVLEKVFEEMD